MGVLALGFGLAGLFTTRGGRATGRGMAVGGLVTGLAGMLLAASLGVLAERTYQDCQHRVGHRPNHTELQECARTSS